jgi:hypothetical protein
MEFSIYQTWIWKELWMRTWTSTKASSTELSKATASTAKEHVEELFGANFTLKGVHTATTSA